MASDQPQPSPPGGGNQPQPSPRGENTRAVHLPPPPLPAQQPLGTPVYRTAAFAFSSSAEYAALLNGQTAGYSYSRIDNPTADAFATAVAALEGQRVAGPTAAQAFASGMAAISAVFWTFTGAGAHVVAPAAVYGGTYGFLRHVAARFGVQADFVDVTDPGQVRAAMRPETRIVYAETLANPTTAVADLPALADIAHRRGALLVVDSTLAPPVICRPLEHGADLVLHSATKYLGGHSDATGGVVSGPPGLIGDVRAVRIDTGGALAPDEAFLLRRGLETLPLRVRRQCSTAMMFAAAVARHPAVRRVDYPGLPGHPGHDTATPAVRCRAAGHPVRRDRHRDPAWWPPGRVRTRGPAACRAGGHVAGGYAYRGQPRGVHDAPAVRRRRPRRSGDRPRSGTVLHRPGRRRGPDRGRAPGPGRAQRRGQQHGGQQQRGAGVNSERKIRVAVVFGGRGPEHAISCASGGTVLACIDRDRYDVVPIGILPDGRWVLTADEPGRLAITGGQLPSVEAVAEPGGRVLPWTAWRLRSGSRRADHRRPRGHPGGAGRG